jgi:hypothetical protein
LQKINDCNIHFGPTCANTFKRTKGVVLQKEKDYFHLIFSMLCGICWFAIFKQKWDETHHGFFALLPKP